MLHAIRNGFAALPRAFKRVALMAFDALALLGVLWVSFVLRLGGFSPTAPHIVLIALAPVIAIPIFIRLGLYRAVIRYLPDRAVFTMVQAMAIATLAWVAALFLAEATRLAVFPRTVPFFYFFFGTIVIVGSRFAAKALLWLPERQGASTGVVIYGAGPAGTQLAEGLMAQNRFYVAAFIDDDRRLWGRDVAGIRVFPPTELADLVRNRGIREVILSLPRADATRRGEIVAETGRLGIKVRTMPPLTDLVSGKYLVNQLREIDIDDLLGRDAVPPDPALFNAMIRGRSVLVTGAGGSIGSELCRLIVRWQPARLVVLEANEFALYEITRKLKALSELPILPVLGSVADSAVVERAMRQYPVDVVFHAAAHKHVPLLEENAFEAVRNNVFGTRNLFAAASAAEVPQVVLISTDKAVRPSSVMGATKRWAELIMRHYALRSGDAARRYCAVRFGNVLGSNGSVVPLFREQIAAGGPVTLTDERMTRYFMSIHEAAELIVEAGALSTGGDIFLLEMGEQIPIRTLAENMIRLAGLTVRDATSPRGDIEIVATGARPGEKLTEELFFDPARAERTSQPRILRAFMPPAAGADFTAALAELKEALDANDEAALRRILFAYAQG